MSGRNQRIWTVSRESSPIKSRESRIQKLTTVEQWFAMWEIISPASPPPISSSQDADQSEDFCWFREYAQSRGAALLAEELRARRHPLTEADEDLNFENIVSQSVYLWFDEWAQGLSPSPQSTSTSTGCLRRDRNEQRSHDGSVSGAPLASRSLGLYTDHISTAPHNGTPFPLAEYLQPADINPGFSFDNGVSFPFDETAYSGQNAVNTTQEPPGRPRY